MAMQLKLGEIPKKLLLSLLGSLAASTFLVFLIDTMLEGTTIDMKLNWLFFLIPISVFFLGLIFYGGPRLNITEKWSFKARRTKDDIGKMIILIIIGFGFYLLVGLMFILITTPDRYPLGH